MRHSTSSPYAICLVEAHGYGDRESFQSGNQRFLVPSVYRSRVRGNHSPFGKCFISFGPSLAAFIHSCFSIAMADSSSPHAAFMNKDEFIQFKLNEYAKDPHVEVSTEVLRWRLAHLFDGHYKMCGSHNRDIHNGVKRVLVRLT